MAPVSGGEVALHTHFQLRTKAIPRRRFQTYTGASRSGVLAAQVCHADIQSKMKVQKAQP